MKTLTTIIFIRNVALCKHFTELLKQLSSIIIIETLQDHFRCIEKLEHCQPNILFIDTEDTLMDYKEFLALINKPPFIIGLIPNEEHVLEYIEEGLFDLLITPNLSLPYLCKKIKRIKTITKALRQKEEGYHLTDVDEMAKYSEKKRPESLWLKHDKCSVRVKFNDILYIKNMGTLLKLFLTNGKTLYHKSTVKQFVAQLPEDAFVRINNATIVNFRKIDVFQKNEISIQDEKFLVTRVYLEQLKNKIV